MRCGSCSTSSRSCVAIRQRDPDLVEAREQLHDLERQLGIEIAGRLVGDQHVGTRRHGARDADALLLARRERDRRMRLAAAKPDLIERGPHALLDLAPARARDDERQRDVVEHAAVVEQLVVLKHDAEPLPERRNLAPRDARRVLVVDEHGAARRALDQTRSSAAACSCPRPTAPSGTRTRRARSRAIRPTAPRGRSR